MLRMSTLTVPGQTRSLRDDQPARILDAVRSGLGDPHILINNAAAVAPLGPAAELEGTGVMVNAYRPGTVDTEMQAWIRAQDPRKIGARLHDRFIRSYTDGALISPQESARSLVARLDLNVTGQIWSVSEVG